MSLFFYSRRDLTVITFKIPVIYMARDVPGNDFDGGKSISRVIGKGGP
jgi:hypothetical protein